MPQLLGGSVSLHWLTLWLGVTRVPAEERRGETGGGGRERKEKSSSFAAVVDVRTLAAKWDLW